MTPLHDLLIARIRRTGPMSIADFMADCLMHPQHGYYTTRDPLGRDGDFITAPEISQMFGELIGLSLAQCWIDQGSPAPFALVELGPGRGTLMADALRATQWVPGFCDAARVHFVEISPALREQQGKSIPDAQWHDRLGTLPDLPLFLIANEFFDALPIRQFVRDAGSWRERMVGEQDGVLQLGLSNSTPLVLLNDRLADTKDGDVIEYCPALPALTQSIGTRIDTDGGAALIIDYGDWHSQGDTLQAVGAHESVSILNAPGQCDLSAHVDFAAIAKHAAPAAHSRLATQGVFLERLGITARAQTLAKALTGEEKKTHIAAHRRLTHPAEMGNLFKVIGLYPTTKTPPPGLEP